MSSETFPVFYSHALGDHVVDGVCECGHLEREHGSKLESASDGFSRRLPHAGSCCAGKENRCACKKFRWVRWMTATEFTGRFPVMQRKRLAKA